MKKSVILSLTVLAATLAVQSSKADVIADWTFQTSASTNNIIGTGKTPSSTQSGVLADIGSGTASASHAASATWSIPAGNGSANSWSVNTWAVNDYYQFSVSTIGFNNITIAYDQTGSGTGPRDFIFEYSTDGSAFTQFGSAYQVQLNGAPNTPWGVGAGVQSLFNVSFDLSSVSAVNDLSAVYFRIVDNSATSIGGGTVAGAGTDRVDNFIVNGVSSVPEPSSIALAAIGGVACLFAVRRKK